jgi:pimeloyl-ACP methyl ester carboxylesterase
MGSAVTKADWSLSRVERTSSGDVRWERLGDSRRPVVVLVHGTPFSSFVWRRVVRRLSRQWQVVVCDLPGFGSSSMFAGQDVSLAAQGRVFAELLAAWHLERPMVVAHDIGGAIALRAHLLHGATYASLALIDVVAVAPWGSPFFRLVREHPDVFSGLPPRLHAALVREYVSDASHRDLRSNTLRRLVEPWLTAHGQAAFYRQIAQADQRHTDEIEGRYPSIDLPVLVAWGADDAWIPIDRGRVLADRIPNARFEVIPDAGHLVQEDAPEHLSRLLSEFLAGGWPRARG